jgi:hypothetical protein
VTDTDDQKSSPDATGPDRAGDMGVSSERTSFSGIESTGTVGSTHGKTDGELDTQAGERTSAAPPADPDAVAVDFEAETDRPSIDRTVGEANTAKVAPHRFDRRKNPGHSHG